MDHAGLIEGVHFFRDGAKIRPIVRGGNDGAPPPAGGQDTPPEGVAAEAWAAMGDPGKAALRAEREARQALEQELRALRVAAANPTPPKPADPPPAPPKPADAPKPGEQVDVDALVKRAVSEALAAVQTQTAAQTAAERVRDAITEAAKAKLHQASDAFAFLRLDGLVDDQGAPDVAKIQAAVDKLAVDKPHLAKIATGGRELPPGSPLGAAGGAPTEADAVKAALVKMQESTGVTLRA